MISKTTFTLIFCILFVSSCVIYPDRKGNVKIHSPKETTIVYNNDTIYLGKRDVKIKSFSNRDTLFIKSVNDSIVVKPKRKIALAVFTYGLAKDYYYPDLYLDTIGKFINYNQYLKQKPKKGNIGLYLSFPYINSFLFKPFNVNETVKSNTGFLGINIGLDYYHNDNQFVDLQLGAMTDFIAPAPAPFDQWEGEMETFSSLYISLSNNYTWNRFRLGYGISLASNKWVWKDLGYYDKEKKEQIYPDISYISRKHIALGLNFPIRYNSGKNFFMGIIYKPYFYQFSDINQFRYQHTISFEFGWRIGLFSKH